MSSRSSGLSLQSAAYNTPYRYNRLNYNHVKVFHVDTLLLRQAETSTRKRSSDPGFWNPSQKKNQNKKQATNSVFDVI